MPVTVTTEDKGDYLHFEVTGSKNLDDGLQLWSEIGRITNEKNFNKILVVENITTGLHDIEIVDIAAQLHSRGLGKVKIAYIDTNKLNIQGLEFAELYVNNRGIDAKLFSDQDEAVAWLRAV